jgi:hypothetical protein
VERRAPVRGSTVVLLPTRSCDTPFTGLPVPDGPRLKVSSCRPDPFTADLAYQPQHNGVAFQPIAIRSC